MNSNFPKKQAGNIKPKSNKDAKDLDILSGFVQKVQQNQNQKGKNNNGSDTKAYDYFSQKSNSINNNTYKQNYPNNRNHSEGKRPQIKYQPTNQKQVDRVLIKDLNKDITNIKIVARLLYRSPYRTYKTKNGQQQYYLNFQFIDESGSIFCSAFGLNADKCSHSLDNVDKIYTITNPLYSQTTYLGEVQRKLVFTHHTSFTYFPNPGNLKIPKFGQSTYTVKELLNVQEKKVVSVKCYVVQQPITKFISKAGNEIKKKILNIYDLQNLISTEICLMFDNALNEYPKGMYILRGVKVIVYNKIKQFQSDKLLYGRKIKNNNKQRISLRNHSFTSVYTQRKETLKSLKKMLQKAEQLSLGQTIFTQTIVHVTGFRKNIQKNCYNSCPSCMKKVQQNATTCRNCQQNFDQPKQRYLLQVKFSDKYKDIWCTANEQAQKLLLLPNEESFKAQDYLQQTEQNLSRRLNFLKNNRFMVKIKTKKDEYKGFHTINHKLMKVFPIDYEKECKFLLEKNQKKKLNEKKQVNIK